MTDIYIMHWIYVFGSVKLLLDGGAQRERASAWRRRS
jgi:hypothetical protein